jgi:hypothetical protein
MKKFPSNVGTLDKTAKNPLQIQAQECNNIASITIKSCWVRIALSVEMPQTTDFNLKLSDESNRLATETRATLITCLIIAHCAPGKGPRVKLKYHIYAECELCSSSSDSDI